MFNCLLLKRRTLKLSLFAQQQSLQISLINAWSILTNFILQSIIKLSLRSDSTALMKILYSIFWSLSVHKLDKVFQFINFLELKYYVKAFTSNHSTKMERKTLHPPLRARGSVKNIYQALHMLSILQHRVGKGRPLTFFLRQTPFLCKRFRTNLLIS